MRPLPRYLTAEVKDILVAVVVLTGAFTIALSRGRYPPFGGSLAIIALVSLAGVVTAFLLHELAHRFMARSYGGIAFFKLWLPGIMMALVFSLIGFIIAAPGAVNIGGIFRKDQIGRTALAGPGTNIAIGVVLFAVIVFMPPSFISFELYQAIFWISAINLWFGMFNLIPLPPLDGEKIYRWSVPIYAAVVVLAVGMNILNGTLLNL